jgi:hypothetical protein
MALLYHRRSYLSRDGGISAEDGGGFTENFQGVGDNAQNVILLSVQISRNFRRKIFEKPLQIEGKCDII